MDVRAEVAVLAATLREVAGGGLFADHVATARVLRSARTAITRLVRELEDGPTNEVRGDGTAGEAAVVDAARVAGAIGSAGPVAEVVT